ncbi:MAG: dockerin type I domain-containing protein [Ruminococcus sp.]|nr:dockerin type I domain-containing protein [Ruminococcus sp.]
MYNLKLRKCMASVTALTVMATAFAGTAMANGFFGNLNTSINSYAASSSVVFTAQKGCAEAAYVQWSPVDNATGYNVYCDGTQLNSMLIRQYAGYFRADAVGLKAGSHTLKVVPVFNGNEDASKSASATVTATAHDRSGFGFVNGTSSGAYNEDGTLKSDARVIYVTDANKDSVSLGVNTGKSEETFTGVMSILNGYKKGKDSRPLCVRFIGNITLPAVNSNGDLYVDTNKEGLTLEGIGNDTTFNGFGIVMKNSSDVEVRNIGFMNTNSSEGDDCGLQQANDHIWVHNCDFFYGNPGGDADQAKGDGALDTKTSTYVTHSYNHFWDNGKCNLQGMKSESTDNYITYHHNWYDHSDSRHPRIRTCSVHVYNNYFDGNAKYGIGVTMGASAFAENNYYRNCGYPMLSSEQGSDVATGGTFSGETGGIIKSFGNFMTGQKSFVTYQQNAADFDAYEASSRTESVPSTVKTKNGGTTYNNFDTSATMYKYTADNAQDVPAKVTANAGRVDGGDFKWTFDNSVDDASYAVNQALKTALTSYKTSILAIGSGFVKDDSPVVTTPAVTTATTAATAPVVTHITTVTTSGSTTPTKPVTGSDVIYCSPNGGGSGASIDSPTDVYSAVSAVKAGGTIYLLNGTYKMDKTLVIEESNSGTASALKTISAYPGAKVVWDFSSLGTSPTNRGVILDGAYWHFYNFEITKAGDNGMLLSGDYNKIERMVFNDNQDTGLQISRYQTSYSTIAQWPTGNYIYNCTSKDNCDDATMENADGFAAKLTCGEGNVFDGCMSYNNSDDGWDLYAKTETGPTGVVTIKNSIAFRNGYTEFGEGYGDCDGNGFKLGGAGVGTAHVVENCLSFENLHCGFTDNNNPLLGSIKNCTAVNNNFGKNGKPNYSAYRCNNCDFDNLISYYGGSAVAVNDKYVGTYANGVYYNGGYYKVDADTKVDNGSKIGTKFSGLTDADFISTSVAPMKSDFDALWRNADGTLNTNGFYTTLSNGSYATMGYRLNSDSPNPPVVTTATTASTTTMTTTTKTTSAQQSVSLYGDANCDGKIDISDVVAVRRSLINSTKFPLSAQGKANSDVQGSGNGINAQDAVTIQQKVLGLVATLPIA